MHGPRQAVASLNESARVSPRFGLWGQARIIRGLRTVSAVPVHCCVVGPQQEEEKDEQYRGYRYMMHLPSCPHLSVLRSYSICVFNGRPRLLAEVNLRNVHPGVAACKNPA